MPFRPAFDSFGNLWVADQLNSRVLEFSGSATAAAAVGAVASKGSAAADETSTTGIKMSVTGESSGYVNFYSSDLGSQPPNTGTQD